MTTQKNKIFMKTKIKYNNPVNRQGSVENELSLRQQMSEKAFQNLSNAIHIKSNVMFEKFYLELVDYFSHHNLPVSINKIDDDNYAFIYNNSAKYAESFIKIYDEDICNITILPNEKGVELFRLEMYKTGSGLGSIFMNALYEVSFNTGVPIFLLQGDPGWNTEGDPKKREKFYKKFNFKKLDRSKYWSNSYVNGKIRPLTCHKADIRININNLK